MLSNVSNNQALGFGVAKRFIPPRVIDGSRTIVEHSTVRVDEKRARQIVGNLPAPELQVLNAQYGVKETAAEVSKLAQQIQSGINMPGLNQLLASKKAELEQLTAKLSKLAKTIH